ncbi:Dolichol-phosphate mannosyltransferase subunit 3 (DPM3) [Nesidiocoris tenuis]|uniref:Dolichol-phosphate mannosyltransferase subunit 3 n=1 Tax=Nesidiocoris tenuis TaxID=355587 RepID=A0ABN7BET3_9HEMI|nr:Dolichol-phosphate mannosyltransferase subunit 3 (DPM3) [Nesidiocoris tenuis]
MTKLLEWIGAVVAGLSIWYVLLTNSIKSQFLAEWRESIALAPFVFLILFGVYSVVVVLWRTATFNDCPEAAKELQEQIVEAKNDLKSKGL